MKYLGWAFIEAGLFCGLVAIFINYFVKERSEDAYNKLRTTSAASSAEPIGLRELPLEVTGLSYSKPQSAMTEDNLIVARKTLTSLPVEKLSTSLLLHILQSNGSDSVCFVEGESDSSEQSVVILELLTNEVLARKYLGRPVFYPSPNGVRVLDSRNIEGGRPSEAHRDQLLATFGGLGVPLSQRLRIGDSDAALSEVLKESLATFHLSQRELEWSAIAYLHYLPPTKEWTSRFNEKFTFDELADELMSRPLVSASCNGLHILTSLAAMLQVDDRYSILSEDKRSLLQARLSKSVDALLVNQESNGSWAPRGVYAIPFARPSHPDSTYADIPDTPTVRRAITSHAVLFLNAMSQHTAISSRTMQSAKSWLVTQLEHMSPEELQEEYCFVSHGLAAVDAVSSSTLRKE